MKSPEDYIKNNESNIFDFVFIGLGASNSLIVLSLIKNGLFKDKKVLIIESSNKSINDKTYCFWAKLSESIVDDLSPIISHQYNEIKVNNTDIQNIENQPYYYIRSIDLYNYTFAKLNQEQISIKRATVKNIREETDFYSVSTQDQTIKTFFIFDSRPPKVNILDTEMIYINQSFFGLHIYCENSVFKEEAFEMMNFNVEQNGATQFFYVIPFSDNEALIELTRFGEKKIELDYASEILNEYILNEYGPYRIIAEESGCIPMTTFENEPSTHRGILKTGTSANLIKASTGYGLKNMYSFAQEVSNRIAQNQFDQFNRINLRRKNRFKFYDTLLLIILLKWPQKGKMIFKQLYKNQSATRIFNFLDEKTSLYNELRIFASLPIFPFLKAVYVFLRQKRSLRYLLAFLMVVSYLILENQNEEIARIFSYISLSIGLLGVGIPHGAVDHLLLKSETFSFPYFLIKYTLGVIVYYILWQLFPLLSLFVFIIYSSLHFGESELVEVKPKLPHLIHQIKSFVLGFSVLLFIIGTHSEEAIEILTLFNLNIDLTPFKSEYIYWPISFFSFLVIFTQNLLSKGNPYLGLLILLVLGIPTSLIVAFGLYFILQHSSNAWHHLKQGLKTNSLGLYKKASFYTLIALLVFGVILLNAEKLNSFQALWSQFFIFLACVSFPHFIVMHLFYKTN